MDMVEHQWNLSKKNEIYVSGSTEIIFNKAAITETRSVCFKCHNKGQAKHICSTKVKGKVTKRVRMVYSDSDSDDDPMY